MARILLVEDEEAVAIATKTVLALEKHVIDLCDSGAVAEHLIKTVEYDLLILDWGLPDTTGLEICRHYRIAGGTAPILFLTARSSVRDKTLGFSDGADDYMTKPFEMAELVLRVNALLRRPRQTVSSVLKAGDINLPIRLRQIAGEHRFRKEVGAVVQPGVRDRIQ